MIIVGVCCSGNGQRFREILEPSLASVLEPGDVVLARPGKGSIAAVYNEVIEFARARTDCEALLLIHEDVQILDPAFRLKVMVALGVSDVGIVGVIGGAGLRSSEWWGGDLTAGFVWETRRIIDMSRRSAEVDVVDGLLLCLARTAFLSIEVDDDVCQGYHGYDVDLCLQARSRGLKVIVAPIDVAHWTKGGYGDREAFDATALRLAAKFPAWIRPKRSAGNMKRALAPWVRLARGSSR